MVRLVEIAMRFYSELGHEEHFSVGVERPCVPYMVQGWRGFRLQQELQSREAAMAPLNSSCEAV